MSGDGRQRNIETTTNTEPPEYAKPYLERVLSEAQTEFESARPDYYPDSTVVGQSPETNLALQMSQQTALGGSPVVQAAQDQARKTLSGDYLKQGNPYLQSAMDAAAKPVMSNIASQFSKGGRLGSGAQADVVARALGDMSSKMAYADYGNERARQQQMMNAVPGLRNLDFDDANRLAKVGAAREAYSQAQLAADIDKFNFGQNVQRQKLGDFGSLVRGGTFGGQTSSVKPHFYNPAANFLGMGLGAASLGSMLTGNPMLAAGGLLGGFGR